MYPVSKLFLDVIANWRAITSTATHRDPFTGATTDLPIIDGTVTVDSTAACRRTLTLTIPPTQALWDALAAPGGEITVTQTVRYIDTSTETVPLGVFVVDQDAMGYATDGNISLTGRDRWVIVQRNRFGIADALRATVPGNPTWMEIKRLVEGAWPNAKYPFPGWSQLDQTATSKVGPRVWDDGSRENAVNTLKDTRLQVFFDPVGKGVLRPTPVLTASTAPAWRVAAGQNGVMINADRQRDRSRTHNVVIATTSASDIYLPPSVKANTNPNDPLSTVGPLGFVPWYLTGNFYTKAAQDAAAVMGLSKQLGMAQQLSLENNTNAALDADDVIGVDLPWIDRSTPRPYEVHIIDSLTVPLLPSGTQQIETRSTRPTADDSGGS